MNGPRYVACSRRFRRANRDGPWHSLVGASPWRVAGVTISAVAWACSVRNVSLRQAGNSQTRLSDILGAYEQEQRQQPGEEGHERQRVEHRVVGSLKLAAHL